MPENQLPELNFGSTDYPYLPPFPLSDIDIDVRLVEEYLDENGTHDYLKLVKEDPLDIDPGDIERLKTYYGRSVEHISEQLVRLINELKNFGVFEKSFIIITGDHGEDFYERNFILHQSLYDTNIRPGMIVKPPAEAAFTVPDTPNLVDLYPTIGEFARENIPDGFDGKSWCAECKQEPRITEQFGEWYNISIEMDEKKGVFTYEAPDGSRSKISQEPILEEFYDIEAIRAGDYEINDHELTETEKQRLRQLAKKFITQDRAAARGEQERKLPAEVSNRLETLGYR